MTCPAAKARDDLVAEGRTQPRYVARHAYRDRSALLDPAVEFNPSLFSWFRASSPEGALLSNIVTVDGRVRGAWRRILNGQSVTVDLRLLKEDKAEAALIVVAAERFGHFLGREVRLLMGEVLSTTIAP